MLDVTKPVRLRNGWSARFICTLDGTKPLLFAVRNPASPESEEILRVPDNGIADWFNTPGPFDVVNTREEITTYVLTGYNKNTKSVVVVSFSDEWDLNSRIRAWGAQGSVIQRIGYETKTFVKHGETWCPKA